MADIELVIKIPQKWFDDMVREEFAEVDELCAVIQHSTPIPKGHGRIADMDEAIKCLEDVEGEDATWAIALIEWACSKRTILEADKEEREGDE